MRELNTRTTFTNLSLAIALLGNSLVWIIILWLLTGIGLTSFIEPILLVAAFQLSLVANVGGFITASIASWRSEPKQRIRRKIFVFCLLFLAVNILIVSWL